jgi:molybdenum cofactor synthesis domain-containing protein
VAETDPTAAVVVVGDEVLSGRIEDSNALYLCRRLTDLGVAVRRVAVVPDEVPAIAAEVAAVAPRFTHVLTSGGVGPTHDDVTMAGVAEGLSRPLVRHPEAAAVIQKFYGPHMADSALRMADLPEGAELITSEAIRFPVVRIANVWVFPGSPHLLQAKFEAVQGQFASTPFTAGVLQVDAAEPEIAAFLGKIQARFPGVAVGSYPQEPGSPVRLLLTARGKDPEAVAACVAALKEGLGEKLVGEGAP